MAKAKLDVKSLIDTGISIALGFIGKLFGGKAKKEISSLQTKANQLLAYDQQQASTIRLLFIGLAGLAVFVVIYFVVRRKK